MKFTETPLPGLIVIEVEPVFDSRGFFARTWCESEFAGRGLSTALRQSGIAFNRLRGTVRGLHFQRPPFAETKIVRCTAGAILDVAVDLRPEAPTYLRYFTIELTARNRTALYIPEGFAHGYQTLEDDTEVAYWMSQLYAPDMPPAFAGTTPPLVSNGRWKLPKSRNAIVIYPLWRTTLPMFDALEREPDAGLGADMCAFVSQLYPICRSITGDGVRQTLRRIGNDLPLSISEVPTGTEVFDWTVPREWNIRDAYVKNSSGVRVIDFQAHNLHLVNYSAPFSGRLSLADLRPHLHSLPIGRIRFPTAPPTTAKTGDSA